MPIRLDAYKSALDESVSKPAVPVLAWDISLGAFMHLVQQWLDRMELHLDTNQLIGSDNLYVKTERLICGRITTL